MNKNEEGEGIFTFLYHNITILGLNYQVFLGNSFFTDIIHIELVAVCFTITP